MFYEAVLMVETDNLDIYSLETNIRKCQMTLIVQLMSNMEQGGHWVTIEINLFHFFTYLTF